VEYETAKRHYAHVDCPGHADYVKVNTSYVLSIQWNIFFIFVNEICLHVKLRISEQIRHLELFH